MKLTIKEGTSEFQVRYVATRTREPTPVMDAMSQFMSAHSQYTVFTDEGKPCAVIAAKRKGIWTQVWVLTTTETDAFPVAVVRAAREITQKLYERHGSLYAVPGADPRVRRLCRAIGMEPIDDKHYAKE